MPSSFSTKSPNLPPGPPEHRLSSSGRIASTVPGISFRRRSGCLGLSCKAFRRDSAALEAEVKGLSGPASEPATPPAPPRGALPRESRLQKSQAPEALPRPSEKAKAAEPSNPPSRPPRPLRAAGRQPAEPLLPGRESTRPGSPMTPKIPCAGKPGRFPHPPQPEP